MLGWSFKGETIETNVVAMTTMNIRKYDNFYVTFDTQNDVIVTRMVLLQPLMEGDSGEKVEFYTISGYQIDNPRQDFENTIAVKSCSSDGLVSPLMDDDYNSLGLYFCPEDQYLSYKNGSEADAYQTVCTADGKWEDEDDYGCSTDLNECDDTSPCGTNADCINTLGSFICQCSPGYSGDPFKDCSEMLDSNIQITFDRSTDGNADDWATSFTGGLYEAQITTTEPFTVGWAFKGENVEYTVELPLPAAKQNRAGDTKFYATFETQSPGVYRSVMNVIAGLDLTDDGEKVEFYLVPAYPSGDRQDFERTIAMKECFDVQNRVTTTTNQNAYGSEGDFICDNGGVLTNDAGSPYVDPSTVCRADGVWENEGVVKCPDGDFSSTISVDDVIGTGYVGDLYAAEISNDVTMIVWSYNQQSAQSYNVESDGSCTLQTDGSADFEVTCEKKGGNLFSTFTLKTPLVATEASSVAFSTNVDPILYQAEFDVKECSVEAPLRVESTNNDYETSGTFGCQSGYYLYLKDGSEPSGTQTTCLITAEWENYDQFACYQPPTPVTIVGDTSMSEAETLQFDCLYFIQDYDVTNIIFYLDDVVVQQGEATTFTKEAEVSDNGKYVRCKAENMVNEGVDDKGGFSLQLMLKIDENECLRANTCGENTDCANLEEIDGSFSCSCKFGYDGEPYQDGCVAIQSNIEVTFERSDGSQGNDWTTGYYGSMYQAEITASNEPYTIGWTYNGQALIYNIDTQSYDVDFRATNETGWYVTYSSIS